MKKFLIIIAAIGAYFIIGYLAKPLFEDSEEVKQIKTEVKFLEEWKVWAAEQSALSKDYVNDLNSIRHEVESAVNGEEYDLKLMMAYFGRDAVRPNHMKQEWDSLYQYHTGQIDRHNGGIQNADRKLDSLNKLLE